MKGKPIKVYDLYPRYDGGYSTKIEDYHGVVVGIAATSIKQAFYFAHNDVWIEPSEARPVGMMFQYRRGFGPPGDYLLWCGCRAFGLGINAFARPRHGQGITAIRQAIEYHGLVCGVAA